MVEQEIHSGLTISGILEQLLPTPADEWCQEALVSYEVATREWQELKDGPKPENVSELIWSARHRRAEKKLAAATIKANAASLVLQLMESSATGDVCFDLPEAEIKVRMKWQK